MKEELITLETAKLAEKKGFKDFGCQNIWLTNAERGFGSELKDILTDIYDKQNIRNFEKELDCPTQSLLKRWLRETKEIYIHVRFYIEDGLKKFSYEVHYIENFELKLHACNINFPSYEKALEEALQKALTF
jgi:hypothetical protein